jgi:O-antigen/teichoic acid export membrane protein
MFGLEMISDVGLGSSIIRDKRGDDVDFLNTAWTLQVLRGALMWAFACLIASPMAAFYKTPELAQLVPVAGLTALIAGFGSTALYTCRRRMEFGRLTILELANEVVGFSVVVLLAWLHPSVWALVAGALISRLVFVVASHTFLPGIRNRLRWEPAASGVIIGFGKWILPSSAFQFLSVQSDRILLGHYLDMTNLGIYSIAITLIDAMHALIIKVNHGVLFPAYGKVIHKEPQRLPSVMLRARFGIDLVLVLPIAALMILGNQIIEILYDARYREAGWMFQILCVRLLMAATLANTEACLVALGHPQYVLIQNVSRAIWILIAIPVAWSFMGMKGAVWAIALSEAPVLLVLWTGLLRHRVFALASEIRSSLFVVLGTILGLGILQLLSW